MITYRMLPLEELGRLEPLFKTLFPDTPMPKPEVASVAVAEDDDQILGFWFLQVCAHAEPVGVDPEKGHMVSLHKLRETLHDGLSGYAGMRYYVCVTDPRWDGPLQRAGFRFIGAMYESEIPQGHE